MEDNEKKQKAERVRKAIQWLVCEGVGSNFEEIGRKMGYGSKSSFSQAIKDKMPKDMANKLCTLSDSLNKEWIETGKGEMRISPPTAASETIAMPREVFDQMAKMTDTILSQQRTIEKLSENREGVVSSTGGMLQTGR